jgi:hypothetical protein
MLAESGCADRDAGGPGTRLRFHDDLDIVQRQSSTEYRDAIQTFRQSPEQGFDKFEQLGAVREVRTWIARRR